MNDFEIKCAKHRQALSEANDLNKAVVFDALATAGITRVAAEFDGSGDSGQIHDVLAYADDKSIEFPPLTVTLHGASWNQEELAASETSLSAGIENLFYGYLEQQHGGWQNNDGAYGEFAIKVAERTITLEFFERYTDYNKYNYSF